MHTYVRSMTVLVWLGPLLWAAPPAKDEAAPEFGMTARPAWQDTKLRGSPEPPLPYVVEPVFAAIRWQRPLYAKAEPGTSNLLVIEQGGEADQPSRILRLDEEAPTTTSLCCAIKDRLVYGLAFDPDYATNGYLYLFSNGPTGEPERQNRISRFTVARAGEQRCDLESELVILEWRSMGHDGGELGFGADGMLYISSGDGTSDSDVWLSGQDVSNLLGGVLRIDVRNAHPEAPYRVPEDNPLVAKPGARGELWAFGLRNPWRLWCDRLSGQIWVGNNGQDLWETVHLIRRGENYGWSVYEGSHPFYAHRQRGPAPIVAPTIEHHHTEARSLTGGVVYRGSQLPELVGAYIYGDYSTGKIWGVRHDGQAVRWHQELADTSLQIAGFAITPAGALVVVDHGGSLQRLQPAPPRPINTNFPRRLSDTGLFTSLADHVPVAGLIPYSINAPAWHDGAIAQRYLAVPDGQQVVATAKRGWNFPDHSVLVQTLSLPGGPTQQRVETRLLIKQDGEWAGYTYRWQDDQRDALLVDKEGEDLRWEAATGNEKPASWHIPSRAECMSCHSRAVNFVLGLSGLQMDRDHDYAAATDNQLRTLHHVGVLSEPPAGDLEALVNPYDSAADLDSRARSYLHANCSSCHVEAGGGNARMELEFTRSLDEMRVISARPQHAHFEIDNAMLVAPGEPQRSVLLHRISRRGPGQMPPLFTRRVDAVGSQLIHDWIASLPRPQQTVVRVWTTSELMERLHHITREPDLAAGAALYQRLGCAQCHRLDDQGGGAGPDLTQTVRQLPQDELIRAMVEPSATITAEYAMTVVVTSDGQVHQGRVEYEDETVLRIRSAESFDRPVSIPKTEIEERSLSPVSMMPAKMLDVCTAEEIYDLVGWLRQRR